MRDWEQMWELENVVFVFQVFHEEHVMKLTR